MTQDTAKDFFISYNKADRTWAEWIAWQLERADYTTIIQAWDFRAGSNFVLEMQQAASTARRTLAVLSPDYLTALYTQPEWAAAFIQDPTGRAHTLLPVRVHPCELSGLLSAIVYLNLVDLDEPEAAAALLAEARGTRAKPTTSPAFPGRTPPPRVAPRFPGALPPIWTIPFRQNPFFTGRDALLTRLHEQLTTAQATALTQPQAINGLGGIGKTQTAIEYAYRYRDEYQTTFWANATTRETLVSDFVSIADILQLPEKDAQDQGLAIAKVKLWLEMNTDWLLILDNADDLKMVGHFLPSGKQGHILLTTRTQAVGTLAQEVEIEKMEPEEGALFLLRRAKIITRDVPLNKASATHRAIARDIVETLDGLPLALDQAGAYIEETQCNLSNYLDLYQKQQNDLLKRRGSVSSDYPESVATTWSLSFEKIQIANPAAADLLRLCAFLSPDAVPEEIITEGAPDLGTLLQSIATDQFKLNNVIAELRKYSLLRRDPNEKTLTIHRLVQAVLKDEMKPDTQRLWAERTVRSVERAFPVVEYTTWSSCQRYLSHAQTCAMLIKQWDMTFTEAAQLLNQTGLYLWQRAQYAEAERFFQQALSIDEKVRGLEHHDIAIDLNNLATLYEDQGKYAQAERLLQQALAIDQKVLGPDHLDVANSLNNLAWLYYVQGKHILAVPLQKKALTIRERELGSGHPAVAQSLGNLAAIYRGQGKYAQAEELYKRALAINEQALGLEHPSVATNLNDLAMLYKDQQNLAEAETLLQRSLAIYNKILGSEHPFTAAPISNLAALYSGQGKSIEAEPLFQRALSIFENALGVEHPRLVIVLRNYAALLLKTGREGEAEKLRIRAKAIQTKYTKENLTQLL